MTTFSPKVSTVTSPVSMAFFNCFASSVASNCSAPSPPAPSKSESLSLSSSLPSGATSSCSGITRLGCCNSVVSCLSVSDIEGLGFGLNSSAITVVPLGCSTTGTTFCTPKASFKEPEICLNFGTLNSANDKINTKKAIKSVAISANVAIQAGAPVGGHLGHSCSSCSSSKTSSAIKVTF